MRKTNECRWKREWLENKAVELFEEMQRKNPHLSWIEIDELCYKQAEKDYMNQPEVDYKKRKKYKKNRRRIKYPINLTN